MAARRPLADPSFRPRQDYKPRRDAMRDPWPHAVCRASMYQDYQKWFDRDFLEAYRGVPFFKDGLPKPEDEFTFFTTMSPWLYILGKKEQVRNYRVPVTVTMEGGVTEEQYRYRYFIRLGSWETHVAAFEIQTGISVGDNVKFFDVERAKRLMEGVSSFRARLTETPTGNVRID